MYGGIRRRKKEGSSFEKCLYTINIAVSFYSSEALPHYKHSAISPPDILGLSHSGYIPYLHILVHSCWWCVEVGKKKKVRRRRPTGKWRLTWLYQVIYCTALKSQLALQYTKINIHRSWYPQERTLHTLTTHQPATYNSHRNHH